MNQQQAPGRTIPLWAILFVAIAALVIATAALTAAVFARGSGFTFGGMMSGWNGTTAVGPGMMGGYRGSTPADGTTSGPGPGQAGFVAGTASSPRVVRVLAGPGTSFTPTTIAVQRGETVTFEVTTMGPAVHEFMVGPADAVAADREGTPEVADIGMMQTKSLTYTFDGSGPYAYACHAPGHYEAGMRGAITIIG